MLAFNANGQVSLQLPQGATSDAYKLYISVHLIDDMGGTAVYSLVNPIVVAPNAILLASLVAAIMNSDTSNPFMIALNSGDLNQVVYQVSALAASTNQVESNATTTLTYDQMALTREYLTQKIVDLPISNVSSIKLMASALSATTFLTEQVSSTTAVSLFLKGMGGYYLGIKNIYQPYLLTSFGVLYVTII